MRVIFLREQVGDGPPHVPQETLGDFGIVHDAPSERDEIRQRIVAAPLLEFLAELRCPVLAADLVAVNQHIVEGLVLADKRTEVIENFLHIAGPVRVERGAAQLVALQTQPTFRRRMIILAATRVADAQNRPAPRRRIPIKLAVRLKSAGEVNDFIALHRQSVWRAVGRRRRIWHQPATVHAALGLDVLNAQARTQGNFRHGQPLAFHRTNGEFDAIKPR